MSTNARYSAKALSECAISLHFQNKSFEEGDRSDGARTGAQDLPRHAGQPSLRPFLNELLTVSNSVFLADERGKVWGLVCVWPWVSRNQRVIFLRRYRGQPALRG